MQFVNAKFTNQSYYTVDIRDGRFDIVTRQNQLIPPSPDSLDVAGNLFLPGMVDLHVHSRSPGAPSKETWQTLGQAAAKGGVVLVCDMPNTDPATVDLASLEIKRQLAASCLVEPMFYWGVTSTNLAMLGNYFAKPPADVCGLKIYYGQTTGDLLFSDLEHLAEALPQPFPGILSFHSEDQCSIEANSRAIQGIKPLAMSSHSNIRSSTTAVTATDRILQWSLRHQRPIHIAHISTPEEVAMIVALNQKSHAGRPLATCEVAPHHLVFSIEDYDRLGGLIKMNPPVRSLREQQGLRQCFQKGQIDCFATDHAPHTLVDKLSKDYDRCPSGVPGVEYFLPLLLSLAKDVGLNIDDAIAMGTTKPLELLGRSQDRGQIKPGFIADFVIVSEQDYQLDDAPEQIASKCGYSPYQGMRLHYRTLQTWHRGHKIYQGAN